jgi:hypothetical protein
MNTASGKLLATKLRDFLLWCVKLSDRRLSLIDVLVFFIFQDDFASGFVSKRRWSRNALIL